MSDHYLRSAWCADERTWWFDKQQSLGLSTDGRVSLARIWPTRLAWPPPFLDERGHETPGYAFFRWGMAVSVVLLCVSTYAAYSAYVEKSGTAPLPCALPTS